MNNEYIVVMGGAVVGDSSQEGPAESKAKSLAAENIGTEVMVFRRQTVFKSRVVVEDDRPQCKDRAK
jgi:hypothetical protein